MAANPGLDEELARLDAAERRWVEEQLALRSRAEIVAVRAGVDAADVFQILRHLQRSPGERLRLGLRHGRLLGAAHRR